MHKLLSISALLLVVSACTNPNSEEHIFNGKNLDGFHIYNQAKTNSKWKVSDGAILCDPKSDGIFGDLVTDQEFENFELSFEWWVKKGGNSGVFINVKEDTAYAATFATGLEMQLLDNANAEHRHQIDSTHWAGCLYSVECNSQNSKPKPYGEWNTAKIIQNKGIVSFWLNDKLTFQDDINSAAFAKKVANSNMKNYPAFNTFKKGKIAFQNHTDSVGFRNIRIKSL
ncbi:3-keto-disaccharide hydrolase [Sphingobacterium hotanense]|uniref:DUF1080 domain-containing protein n=1 Tax=Sphingobacterium hotanense TaxID=649196 RepID=A0ABT7NIY2_9SPHI|nr:DUF1080 domain-containing protein [Sphingobacterium hotanense]MDM1047146.1 DUF1080 domain-containing protein [Sphingobacterium hotanense]